MRKATATLLASLAALAVSSAGAGQEFRGSEGGRTASFVILSFLRAKSRWFVDAGSMSGDRPANAHAAKIARPRRG
jgi:hypothetical protein